MKIIKRAKSDDDEHVFVLNVVVLSKGSVEQARYC
jgi:hypothetical protein